MKQAADLQARPYGGKKNHPITGLIGSTPWFDKLPKNLQQIVREESLNVGDHAPRMTMESLVQVEKDIQEKGMIVSEPDLKPFIEN